MYADGHIELSKLDTADIEFSLNEKDYMNGEGRLRLPCDYTKARRKLAPVSLYPYCDFCATREKAKGPFVQVGRWWWHQQCVPLAELYCPATFALPPFDNWIMGEHPNAHIARMKKCERFRYEKGSLLALMEAMTAAALPEPVSAEQVA